MGVEKAMSAVAAGLAGANMIYESAGMSASLLGVSFEAFVIDNEMLSHVHRLVRGFEVNEETLGYQAVLDAVTGEGHFLGSPHTMDAMQRDYFYPTLADRDDPRSWAENDAPDIWQKAREKAKATLSDHHPKYLTSAAERSIRSRYPIRM